MTGEKVPYMEAQLGGDVTCVRDDLQWAIVQSIAAHPRSLQAAVGPSELGTPCARKLGYKLAGAPKVRPSTPLNQWRPTVGTAVHTWLEGALQRFNQSCGETRFLTEHTVIVGEVDGVEVRGHCDVYDIMTGTVIDWKVVGKTSLDKARRAGPSATYRAQAHLYGRGWANRPLPIEHVAIYWLPASGALTDAVWWSEPYDETVALEALSRADGIATAIRLLGADVIVPQLATADDFCASCEWFSPGGRIALSCPGDAKAATASPKRDDLAGILLIRQPTDKVLK